MLIPIAGMCNRLYGTSNPVIQDRLTIGLWALATHAALWHPVYAANGWLGLALLFPALYAAMYGQRAPGKGKWFPHTGDTSNERESTSPVVDTVTGLFFGKYMGYTPAARALNYKTFATGFAWALTGTPKYAVIAIATGSLFPLYGIPAMIGVGLVYRYCFTKWPNIYSPDRKTIIRNSEVPQSEKYSGAYIGLVDATISAIILIAII